MTLPRPGLVHVRQARPRGEERAVDVNGQHFLPVRVAKFLERMDDLDAGVADEDVDPAVGLDRRGYARC